MEANKIFNLCIDNAATGSRIISLLRQAGISREEVMEATGISSTQALYKWKKGQSIPSTDNLVRLSVMLHVPMEDLLVITGGPDQEIADDLIA